MFSGQHRVDASLLCEIMVDYSHSAITGIKDAVHESFIASTLYSQGWNITSRTLDFSDLNVALTKAQEPKPILLISTDLDGVTPQGLAELRSRGFTLFLFSAHPERESEFANVSLFPTSALELMGIIRGSLRAPLIRTSARESAKSARTIAISSASHGAGCTLVAINIATELSLLGQKTLLVDADSTQPAIATVLGHRGLRESALRVSENLFATEMSQKNLAADITRLHEAENQYQFIILDLGMIHNFASSLTSRRWESEALIWVSQNADQLCLVTKDDQLALERLRKLLREITQNSIHPALSIIHNMRRPGKKNDRDESLLQSTKASKPVTTLHIPLDMRSAQRAENSHCSLYEASEKSALRRALAEIAGKFIK